MPNKRIEFARAARPTRKGRSAFACGSTVAFGLEERRVIHRSSRNALALALRRYVSGRITNDDLDDVDVDWRDRGAVAVKEMAWSLYDDMREHRIGHDLPRGSDARRTIARWIVFLHCDAEYLWPEYSFIQFVNWPLNILTLGWWEKHKARRWQELLEAGDFNAWPFCARRELERAASSPRLFANGRPAEQAVAADRPTGAG